MRERTKTLVFLFGSLFLFNPMLRAQQSTVANATVDKQALLDRIQQLEQRLDELEKRSNDQNSSPAATVPQSVAESPQPPAEAVKEISDQDRGLKIRGFGQLTYIADDLRGDRPALQAGNFTLLLTSRLSDRLSAISEIAIDEDGYGDSRFGIALERALLQYEHNDYFKIDAGRYYSSIGYYNTAFYNADWAQTTMRRPIIAAFQDDGGLMPMQRNGVSISGRLPWANALGLHYVAEIGGGDITRSDVLGLGYEFPLQARTGVNFALFARPQAINGLQFGGSFYHDTEIPFISGDGDPLVRQNIYSAYAVYHNTKWEFLNEAYLIHHCVVNDRNYNVPAFYTQISRRLTAAWRPYFRFSYLNAGRNDPMLPDQNGRTTGIETGARYNFSEWVGLKFEYGRMQIHEQQKSINFGGSQLVFTF